MDSSSSYVKSLAELLQKHAAEREQCGTSTSPTLLDKPKTSFMQRFFSMGDHRCVVMEAERQRANSNPPSSDLGDHLVPVRGADDGDLYSDVIDDSLSGVDVTDTDDPDKVRLSSLHSLRSKIVFIIHHRIVELILMGLLVLDVLVVIVELIIDAHQECHMNIIPEMCIGYEEGHYPHSEHSFTQNSSGLFAPAGCGVFGHTTLQHNLHPVEVALGWISKVVLMIFAVELTTLMCCLGREFFTILYTLDTIVVFLSLIFAFVFDPSDGAETGLIVFLRVWRFARVLHGFGVTVHNKEEHADDGDHDGELKEDTEKRFAAGVPSQINIYKTKSAMGIEQEKELIAFCRLVEQVCDSLRK